VNEDIITGIFCDVDDFCGALEKYVKAIITASGFIRRLTIFRLMIIIQRKLLNFVYQLGYSPVLPRDRCNTT